MTHHDEKKVILEGDLQKDELKELKYQINDIHTHTDRQLTHILIIIITVYEVISVSDIILQEIQVSSVDTGSHLL